MTFQDRREKLLSSRVRDLKYPLRRLVGLDALRTRKYLYDLPEKDEQERIKQIVLTIRGSDYKPAIFILGVMPRCGTNYLADLFKKHPRITAHPRTFYEFPLLSITDNVAELQREFSQVYRRAAAVLQPYEFSAYLNAGMMSTLQESSGKSRTMLFKFPFVHHLGAFRMLFPRDHLILLLRDGRDVVASSLKTFRQGLNRKRFSEYCREWRVAADAILQYECCAANEEGRAKIIRYEELLSAPEDVMRATLRYFGLDVDLYDSEGLDQLPLRGSSSVRGGGGKVTWQPIDKPRDFQSTGRWNSWSDYKKRRFMSIAGSTLVAAGYKASRE